MEHPVCNLADRYAVIHRIRYMELPEAVVEVTENPGAAKTDCRTGRISGGCFGVHRDAVYGRIPKTDNLSSGGTCYES